MILFGELEIHFAERGDISVCGEVRDLHAADDDASLRISRFYLVNDGLKIRSNLVDRHADECVVDAELENKDVDVAFEVRRQPGEPARGRAAALAGVDDFELQTGVAQFIQKQRGICLATFEMKAVRQTVAENEDRFHW